MIELYYLEDVQFLYVTEAPASGSRKAWNQIEKNFMEFCHVFAQNVGSIEE